MADPSRRFRRRLVRALEAGGSIRDPAVGRAFAAVPRELFIPEFAAREGVEAVYRDEAVPTKFDAQGQAISSSSQPAVMAAMLSELRLAQGMRVLEIGAGTGYNAALLAYLVGRPGRVTTIDIDAGIARGARAALRRGGYAAVVVVGDGRGGYLRGAPYDRIVVTASTETVPRAWFDQLAEGGLVEAPLRITTLGSQVIATLAKTPSGLHATAVICGGFMPLRSADGADQAPAALPFLAARDGTAGAAGPPLRFITGRALAALAPAARRRLLAVSLADPGRRPLGLRAPAETLALYLSLTLPSARAVRVDPGWGVGLVSRDGRSLAYVSGCGRWIRSLSAHGTPAAAEELLAAVGRWDALGRPGVGELELSVAAAGGNELVPEWRRPGARRHR